MGRVGGISVSIVAKVAQWRHDVPALLQVPFGVRTPRAVSGSGAFITLSDGRRVLDADGSAAVICIGHGDKRVIEAIKRQAETLAFTWSGTFGSDASDELASLILDGAPGGLTHAFFASSGSEAVEASLKFARQYFVELGEPDRTHFIGRKQSFHGVTLGALNVGGHHARRQPFEPFLSSNFSHVSPCFAFHDQRIDESEADYVQRLRSELEGEFERVGPHRVVAFCAETVVGGTLGAAAAVPGYFAAMREVCDKYGALLILDEVMCGMGRTGDSHAWLAEGVAPDIQTIGKALGGGYIPISATLCSGKIAETVLQGSGMFTHGHTYQAHPVACAAAIAVQGVIREERLLDNVRGMGRSLMDQLESRLCAKPWLGQVRGRGLLVGVEFLMDPSTKKPFQPSENAAHRVKAVALELGLSVFAGKGTIDGQRGDHIFLAPPFNIQSSEVEMIAKTLEEAASAALDPLMSKA